MLISNSFATSLISSMNKSLSSSLPSSSRRPISERFAGELEASQVWKRSDVTLLRLPRLRTFSSCSTLGVLLGAFICGIHDFCNFCRS
ncbi:hypothetical protein X777_07617 [Ooceraea biroi]|uniref:Uncharacterized protein n=1 Tax=Ooceraea biroi TaxID=2015173 RepID=A0A026X3C9_OOCBI|nr:hypothetical protein X777_07617 [Ooceraea biroi]